MRFIKNFLSVLAVSATAMLNTASAQSEQFLLTSNPNGDRLIEITYNADEPANISFRIVGEGTSNINVGLYGQLSNASNGNGTCTAVYDVEKLMSCGAGELFATAYNSAETYFVYNGGQDDKNKSLIIEQSAIK